MRWVVIGVCAVALGGCLQSVTIPAQEASLKEACHGKDRPMVGVAGYSVWRCGEGDRAKYGIYKQGTLVREANELEAAQTAAAFACIGRGLKPGAPEFAACSQGVSSVALSATSSLRDSENAEADARRQAAADSLIAAGAALSAASAVPQQQSVRLQANCSSFRTGSMVSTNCY